MPFMAPCLLPADGATWTLSGTSCLNLGTGSLDLMHSDGSAVFIRQCMGLTPWWHGASLRRRVQPVHIAINV